MSMEIDQFGKFLTTIRNCGVTDEHLHPVPNMGVLSYNTMIDRNDAAAMVSAPCETPNYIGDELKATLQEVLDPEFQERLTVSYEPSDEAFNIVYRIRMTAQDKEMKEIEEKYQLKICEHAMIKAK
jgi:hypothetical protein